MSHPFPPRAASSHAVVSGCVPAQLLRQLADRTFDDPVEVPAAKFQPMTLAPEEGEAGGLLPAEGCVWTLWAEHYGANPPMPGDRVRNPADGSLWVVDTVERAVKDTRSRLTCYRVLA